MTQPLKVSGLYVKEIDGQIAVIFSSTTENGEKVELAIPANALQTTLSEASTRVDAFVAQRGGQKPGWKFAMMREPKTLNVGTPIDPGKIALIVDRDLPTEVTYLLPSDWCTELSQLLLEEAQKAGIPQTKN